MRVDVVGVRLHGPGDQDDGPWRPARERVDVERDVLGGQPGREPLVVGGVAGGGPQAVEDVGHVLLVALPGDVGGGELHERPGPLVGQHPRRVGADVAEQHVGPVVDECGAGLWQDVDPLVEEAGHPCDGVVGPGLPAVLVGEHGGDRQDGGTGGGDGRCEPGRSGDLDAVAARDQLREHRQVRVHVPVCGHADHDDVQRGHRCDGNSGPAPRPRQSARARRRAAASSAICRWDTSADRIACDPWKVPGHWCSSTDTPACSRRSA